MSVKVRLMVPASSPTSMMYRNLNSAELVQTARSLQQRISERFPASGLSKVVGELVQVAEEAADVSEWLAKPHRPLRVLGWAGIGLIVVLLFAALVTAGNFLQAGPAFSSVADLLQGLDAAINEVVVTGVAIFFLFTLEVRLKRAKALRALHVLRSMAHIIDMHQLTKDPERSLNHDRKTDTASSPKRTLTPFELTRYLDYCAEALSVISKLAALYVQRFDDPVTLSAVNDIEQLTSGLSRKIWQKIMIVDRCIAPPALAENFPRGTDGSVC